MADYSLSALPHRGLLRLSGADSTGFLQDLLSNDMDKADEKNLIYALLLTSQGRFLFDFFIQRLKNENGTSYRLDCLKADQDLIIAKFNLYRLRADIHITIEEDEKIWFLWGKDCDDYANHYIGHYASNHANHSANHDKTIFKDPRHPDLGWRLRTPLLPEAIKNHQSDLESYHLHRLELGIAEAGFELTGERFPLECNLDNHNAIDFHKGCYIGQEVTSRMKRRADGGRKRMALAISQTTLSDLPNGADVFCNQNKIGFFLSHFGKKGLALIRQDKITQPPLFQCEGHKLSLRFLLD